MAKKVTTERVIESEIRAYEIMILLTPDLLESAVNKKLKEITSAITNAGGKITEEDFWGKRDLAYRMKGFSEGIYMVYNVEMPQSFVKELTEQLRIEKDVLRSMIMSIPGDYTYTKYDLEVPAENTNSQDREEKKKRAEEKKKQEAKKSAAEKKDLDKKLESILEDDALKL